MNIVSWGGYDFSSHDPNETRWNDVAGVYIFAGVSDDGRWWLSKYIGQTSSFKERLGEQINDHERWEEAVLCGATHVHARVVQDEIERLSLESTLILTYNPPMNTR